MLPPPLYTHTIRIYWEDTDAGGIVFYANYLKFFERARTEWLRSLGWAQQRMKDDDGVIFIVTDTQVHYRKPAKLDDLLQVDVRLESRGRVRFVLTQQAHCEGVLLAEGRIGIACVQAGTFAPRRIPNELLEALPG